MGKTNINYLSICNEKGNFKPNNQILGYLKVRIKVIETDRYRIFISDNLQFYKKKDLYCIVLGDIYGYRSPEDIFNIYDNHNRVKEFDGFFTLVFVNRDEIKVISDQTCLYPVYYYQNENVILSTICYEIASFITAIPNSDEINIYLCLGKPLLGNTIYNDIHVTKPEIALILTNSSAQEVNYSCEQDFIDIDAPIGNIANDLKKIIRNGYNYIENKYKKILCDLSGGADSRITTLLASKHFDDILWRTF